MNVVGFTFLKKNVYWSLFSVILTSQVSAQVLASFYNSQMGDFVEQEKFETEIDFTDSCIEQKQNPPQMSVQVYLSFYLFRPLFGYPWYFISLNFPNIWFPSFFLSLIETALSS